MLVGVRLLLACLVACGGGGGAAPPDVSVSIDAAIDLPTALGDNGLRAAAGSFEFLDLSQCCASSCAGNNPSSPYGAIFAPAGPDETTPNPHARADGLSAAFRLRADEAIVLVGPMPPSARYIGYTPYLDDRDDGMGGRRIVAASLSETLNNLVIASDEGRIAIVATGDAGTEAKVRTAMAQAGIAHVNTLIFDPAVAHFGSDAAADTFGVLFRIALADDADALAAFMAQPGAQVWRVTPNALAPQPEPSPVARAKNTTLSEKSLAPSVDALASAIAAAYPGYTAQELAVDDGVPDPAACIAGTATCAYDNRDTTYPATSAGIVFAHDDDFYVVFGVDHAVSGKTSYANASVYALQHLVGIASVASNHYPGSAAQYVSTDADKLYAYTLARTCTGPYCLEVPVGSCPSGIANDALGALAFRTYLEPSTATAPDPSTLVRDRVIRFRKN